jgi:uncharacterized protein (TIGR02996 family)
MTEETAFVASLRMAPGDNDIRLVYADWLEDQGNPLSAAKAEFLRLTVQAADHGDSKQKVKARQRRLQQLAAEFDTAWLAVVSRLAIENCQRRQRQQTQQPMRTVKFEFVCDRQWQDLQPTEDNGVRFCEACKENVYYCDTIMEARGHAWAGHCIAVDLGVIRRDRDLENQSMVAGIVSEQWLRREEERMKPDAVSADRERRKQAAIIAARGSQLVNGWKSCGVAVEGEPIDVGGLNPWDHSWGLLDRLSVDLPHPTQPNQRHRMPIYEIEGEGKTVIFAAAELSGGVWGFYTPAEPSTT